MILKKLNQYEINKFAQTLVENVDNNTSKEGIDIAEDIFDKLVDNLSIEELEKLV